MNLMQSGGDTNALLQSLMANNPQMSAVMSLINQYHGDAKAAFYDQAAKMGVDPNQVLNLLM